ncbi:MAG: hypothetical protein LAN64_16180 [Acidobacteriia bacterium]|nr:hypothetical protein [Terriglobia bacterium]
MRRLFCFILLVVTVVGAKDRKDIPQAPLPAEILTAKKIFVSKGVGTTAFTVKEGFDLAFDAFYADIKSWGRYVITDKADDADLIMQVSYTAGTGGTNVWSATNPNTNQTTVFSSQIFNCNLSLVVYDSRTKTELWSTSVSPGVARRKKNQEKEMIKAGEKLVTNLKQRANTSTPAFLSTSGPGEKATSTPTP